MRVAMIMLGLAGVLTLALVAVGLLKHDPDDPLRVADEFGWFPGSGRPAYRWTPAQLAGSGMAYALATDGNRRRCVLYHGGGYGGGSCFTSGWAVEIQTLDTPGGTVYIGAVIPETASVRFGRSREALTLPAFDVPGQGRFVAVLVPDGALRGVRGNDIVALDARGRLLGRQHANDGHGGFGAFDGLYDRR